MSENSQESTGSPGGGDTDTESLYGAPPDGSAAPPDVEDGEPLTEPVQEWEPTVEP